MNLFMYCGNDPVNMVDPSGNIAWWIVLVVAGLAATAYDIYQIARGEDNGEGLKVSASEDNVHIENSYKVITPWMRWGYSFYLNHIKEETRDVIQGSTAGVQLEWELHNYASWLGFGGESAKHVDIGNTIFSDGKVHPLRDSEGNISTTGVMSFAMRAAHIVFASPIAWIYELIKNGGF